MGGDLPGTEPYRQAWSEIIRGKGGTPNDTRVDKTNE